MTAQPIMELAPFQQSFIDTVFGSTFYQWTGCELVGLQPDEAIVRVRPPAGIVTPWGGVNGAVIGALLELPAALAVVPGLEEGQTPVTNDLFVQHMKGIPGTAEIFFEGRVLRRGRTMAWCESRATVDGKAHSIARITKTIVSA